MGTKSAKVWGYTELVLANSQFEFHRIEFRAGYKCSEHKHKTKSNGFFIESGSMLVRVWDGDDVNEIILGPGDFTAVPPGVYHQFEGIKSGVAFELYWAEFDPNDIERRTLGCKVK